MTSSMSCSTTRTVSPPSSRRRRVSSMTARVSRGVGAARGLVEEQQPRLGSERARDLEALLGAERQAAGLDAGDLGEADALEERAGGGPRAPPPPPPPRGAPGA